MVRMAFSTESKNTKHPTKSISKRLMIAVRIRPLQAEEIGRSIHRVNDQIVVLEENEADKNDILRHNRGGERQYVFDAVFGEDVSQETIFDSTTKSLVKDVLEGYNATIFAYGASGSGKTHTMLGNTSEPGIMIRALNEIFTVIKSNPFRQQFSVTMSYLEIYNENIRDLLNPNSGFLELREDQKEKTIQVVKLSEVSTNSTEEMMRLLQKGNKARTMEPTALNKTSSRSHALLSITVRQTFPLQNDEKLNIRVKQGKLFMIDLAGSERASQTKNEGKRLVEGAHINRSLLALGNCINALSGGARYVNYRDSKLTRLLKNALSGNSQTCMIAHVSPAAIHREESKNTLIYADRAKNISNRVEKNVLDISHQISQYRNIISELKDEIVRLKSKIPEDKNIRRNKAKIKEPENNEGKGSEQFPSNEANWNALKNEIIMTFREQMKLRKRLLSIESYLLELDLEAERQTSVIYEHEGKSNRIYRIDTHTNKMPVQPDLGSLDLDFLKKWNLGNINGFGLLHRLISQVVEDEGKSKLVRRHSSAPFADDFASVVSRATITLQITLKKPYWRKRYYQEIDKDPRKSLEKSLLELALIEKEQEKYSEMKTLTETELEKCKEKAALLEKELPYEINTEDEKELLSLLIRVYELEIEKIVFQSERLTREYKLRQKDVTIEKCNRHRQICEDIILRQREIMEEGNLSLPPDLLKLYQLYHQEIYLSTYADHNLNEITCSHSSGRLPPIKNRRMDYFQRAQSSENGLDDSDNSTRTPSSSAGSDWPSSPLPPIVRKRFSTSSTNNNSPSAASVLFPPISQAHQEFR